MGTLETICCFVRTMEGAAGVTAANHWDASPPLAIFTEGIVGVKGAGREEKTEDKHGASFPPVAHRDPLKIFSVFHALISC